MVRTAAVKDLPDLAGGLQGHLAPHVIDGPQPRAAGQERVVDPVGHAGDQRVRAAARSATRPGTSLEGSLVRNYLTNVRVRLTTGGGVAATACTGPGSLAGAAQRLTRSPAAPSRPARAA